MMTFGVADCSLDELPFKIIEIRAKRGFERFRPVYRSGGRYLHVPVCSWNICEQIVSLFCLQPQGVNPSATCLVI